MPTRTLEVDSNPKTIVQASIDEVVIQTMDGKCIALQRSELLECLKAMNSKSTQAAILDARLRQASSETEQR